MKKFLYQVVYIDPHSNSVRGITGIKTLRELGAAGWELVSSAVEVYGRNDISYGVGGGEIKGEPYWIAKKEVEK